MHSVLNRIYNMEEMIYSDELVELGRVDEKDFTRNRKMPFSDMVKYMLGKKGLSNVLDLFKYFKAKEMDNISNQAFSKGRMKLNPIVFKELTMSYLRDVYENTDIETFKDCFVLAGDGSVQKLVNNENLEEEYGAVSNQDGSVSVSANSSAILDCLNKYIIDFGIYPYKTSERVMIKENVKNILEFFPDPEKLLLTFDRGYPSLELFHNLLKKEVKFLFRIKISSYKKEKKDMKTRDEYVSIQINKNRLQNIDDEKIKNELLEKGELRLRITKVKLSTGEEEHLISNLDMDDFTTKDIKQLYKLRWEIEKGYEVMKNKLKIEYISGYTKTAVEQDFYSQILLYNITQDIRNRADKTIKKKKRKLKYKYQCNINIIIGLLKETLFEIFFEKNLRIIKTKWKNITKEIKRNLVPIIKNRIFPHIKSKGKIKQPANMRRNS